MFGRVSNASDASGAINYNDSIRERKQLTLLVRSKHARFSINAKLLKTDDDMDDGHGLHKGGS